ncbi:hypothetical protein CBM2626_B120189 [Cupriavidus taiwanensis]|nr:hypothetical protein CBM2626_B120189 [Cupriavidus taiwanensis]
MITLWPMADMAHRTRRVFDLAAFYSFTLTTDVPIQLFLR